MTCLVCRCSAPPFVFPAPAPGLFASRELVSPLFYVNVKQFQKVRVGVLYCLPLLHTRLRAVILPVTPPSCGAVRRLFQSVALVQLSSIQYIFTHETDHAFSLSFRQTQPRVRSHFYGTHISKPLLEAHIAKRPTADPDMTSKTGATLPTPG